MTEADWLAGAPDGDGLEALFRRVESPGDRKQRLAVLGVLRLLDGGRGGPLSLRVMAAYEDAVDHHDSDRLHREAGPRHDVAGYALDHPDWAFHRAVRIGTRGFVNGRDCRVRQLPADPAWAAARDVFGNPFRPVVFDPGWRTEAVVGLARGMYESRDFAVMPVLADALEDAGCSDEGVLSHCRGGGPHVRGCWVVDAVLGKA